jgi:hypothetical protein
METLREPRMQAGRPSFLITIDTEGDSEWARPQEITTRNARYVPRFQALCERYGLKPTYLTTYEMARCPDFQEFGRDAVKRGTAEIGLHLHAWSSPPLVPLTSDDLKHHPYLIEYPDAVMREKTDVLTGVLEETFGLKMVSHRAGRWAFDSRYARILVERGYRVDCSVTPYLSWRHYKGAPNGRGGSDYSRFPDVAYFVDLDDIARSGDSTLLEVPMTTVPARRPLAKLGRARLSNGPRVVRALGNRLFPVRWLRPIGEDVAQMLGVLRDAREDGRDYVEFMLHSSELMPGGSPRFETDGDIDRLYAGMEQVFQAASHAFQGRTLSEYYDAARATRGPVRR